MKKLSILICVFGFTILSCSNPTPPPPVQDSTAEIKAKEIEPVSVSYVSDAEFIEVSSKEISMANGKKSRYHAIFVKNFNSNDEKIWNDMSTFANNHFICEEGGFLVVYFFDEEGIPFNTSTNLEWDGIYDKNCVGAKWCYPSGEEKMKRFPMK